MSEMFTKCNGFIVSGDPLVYADSATMTGQGTVSEPFGVKSTDLFVQEPLYTGVSGNSAYIGWNNETVLWSGSLTVGNTAQMLEPVSAFESYKIYLLGYERKLKVVNEFWTDGASTGNEPYKVNPIIFQAGGSFFTINAGDCKWNTTWDNLQYVTGYNKWMPYTGSTWNQIDTNTNSPTIIKIVGINRKV